MRQLQSRSHIVSFAEHMEGVTEKFRLEAETLPPGLKRDAILRKMRYAKIASEVDLWLCSPGLQPPR